MSGEPTRLTPRFAEALEYAAQLHGGQHRKGSSVPYLAHLLAVASIVLEHGASEDEAIAALLHDAVEDQGGQQTAAEIERRFGPAVAEIVWGCTDADSIPKPPWRARKESHLASLTNASLSVRLVIAADKLHNARSLVQDYRVLGEGLWSRFSGGREGTLWYYRAVATALAETTTLNNTFHTALVNELDQAVTELERLVDVEK